MQEVSIESSISWDGEAAVTIDQRALPDECLTLRLRNVDEVIEAIRTLAVRGAPTIGVAGAFGVALATRAGGAEEQVRDEAARITAARPTARNLRWAVERAVARLPEGPDAVLNEALTILAEDGAANRSAAGRAADLVGGLIPGRSLRLLTHCNTGRLATTSTGTALGAILELAKMGRVAEVLVDETRPLLQGARLTAWELGNAGVPYRLCVDSAAAAAISRGMVDCVLVGADWIAANGDVANKIGTYGLAVACARSGVPFIVVAPESTLDGATPDGGGIEIEERDADEVARLARTRVAPVGAKVFNPAFDVTPADLVTAIVTDERIIHPQGGSLGERLARCVRTVPGFPEPGVLFRDLSAFYADPRLVNAVAAELAARFRGGFDLVAGIEARGFLLGIAVAQVAGTPFVAIRKPGKLPGELHAMTYGLEYGEDVLEIQRSAVPPGDRVLIVDDVLATGGTMACAADLVARCGGRSTGCAVALELDGLGGRNRLAPHAVHAVLTLGEDE
ncbi:S-methyl-5-thioribose-1-phosphate isomerase/adenine phosphoribosyltransferase,TIGR01090 [Actinomadura pelletieri DSM 43383]|uniref:Multifunctional fusion protein n=1 Tax=Actinomadura pelletieri DSM 43383 TaxID=1120940 RepID=A0A495Q9R1_9ACTN|nr:S-methyl-5-thioribose-1-phosphate isomerase [Actinomadura pelletieri]RKS68225.1 S-methyl-5-thioribose-1-phosphate isomerase/adenine phosphoribosyltransferase,TIGR01090 [Actinomadura pelletieri DSM 43383]